MENKWLSELFDFLYESRDNELLFVKTLQDMLEKHLRENINETGTYAHRDGYARNGGISFQHNVAMDVQYYEIGIRCYEGGGIEGGVTLKLTRRDSVVTITKEMEVEYTVKTETGSVRYRYAPNIEAAYLYTVRNKNINIFKANL